MTRQIRPPIPLRIQESVLRRQTYQCGTCNRPLESRLYDIDHIIPYCVRLCHEPENLQALCLDDHRKKSRRDAAKIAAWKRELLTSFRTCWKCERTVSAYWDSASRGLCQRCESL
jgi:5-methylcytosine-specific restriction enzyme A